MTDEPLRSTGAPLSIRTADLARRGGAAFEIEPDAPARASIAADLDLLGLRKLRLTGTLAPQGKHDWHLRATLGATVVQPCVITAEPVTTRLDLPVERRFLRDMPTPTEAEAEMPEDDTLEPLQAEIDLSRVLIEALSLALPDYPRAPGAQFDDITTEDERPNPFAALAALKNPGTASD